MGVIVELQKLRGVVLDQSSHVQRRNHYRDKIFMKSGRGMSLCVIVAGLLYE